MRIIVIRGNSRDELVSDGIPRDVVPRPLRHIHSTFYGFNKATSMIELNYGETYPLWQSMFVNNNSDGSFA